MYNSCIVKQQVPTMTMFIAIVVFFIIWLVLQSMSTWLTKQTPDSKPEGLIPTQARVSRRCSRRRGL